MGGHGRVSRCWSGFVFVIEDVAMGMGGVLSSRNPEIQCEIRVKSAIRNVKSSECPEKEYTIVYIFKPIPWISRYYRGFHADFTQDFTPDFRISESMSGSGRQGMRMPAFFGLPFGASH